MRKRYKKRLSKITKAIRLLNKAFEYDPNIRGRYFAKQIAFATFDMDRADPKNNNFCVVVRFYDKETGNYTERLAYIDTSSEFFAASFGYYTYKDFAEDIIAYFDCPGSRTDYRKITQNETIKRGHNIHSYMKYTKRKD